MCEVSEGKEGEASSTELSPQRGIWGCLKVVVFEGTSFPLVLVVHWDIVWPVEIGPHSSCFHHKCHKMKSHPLTIQLESPRCSPRWGLLCLSGISHLFISFPREGELMLFGTDKGNNAANIYSSALTPAGLSLALNMAGIRAGCFSSSIHSSNGTHSPSV